MTCDVFISHSSKDIRIATRVCETLEQHGIRCWISSRDIHPAQEWDEAIVEALEACRLVVLVFSASSNQSPHVRREIQLACDDGRQVVPFRIEKIFPTGALRYYIPTVQFLDALTEPLEPHLTSLAETVGFLLNPDGVPDAEVEPDLLAAEKYRKNEQTQTVPAAPSASPGNRTAEPMVTVPPARPTPQVSEAQRHVLTGHTDTLWSVAFSPDGLTALSGSSDNTLRLWNLQSGQEIRQFSARSGRIRVLGVTPEAAQNMTAAGQQPPAMHSLETRSQVGYFAVPLDSLSSVAFLKENSRITPGQWDFATPLMDGGSGRRIGLFVGLTAEIHCVAFAPDGRHALSGDSDCLLRCWEIETGQEIRAFTGHTETVEAIRFVANDRRFLSAGSDGTLRLWDMETGQELRCFQENQYAAPMLCLALAPDGRSAAIGGQDGWLRLWNLETGALERGIEKHDGSVTQVAFLPGSSRLLSSGDDHTVRTWNLKTGQQVDSFDFGGYAPLCVAFSAEGRLALTGGSDATVRLWDLPRRSEITRLNGHTAPVTTVTFSPDGRRALSGSDDTTVRLWNLP